MCFPLQGWETRGHKSASICLSTHPRGHKNSYRGVLGLPPWIEQNNCLVATGVDTAQTASCTTVHIDGCRLPCSSHENQTFSARSSRGFIVSLNFFVKKKYRNSSVYLRLSQLWPARAHLHKLPDQIPY